MGRLVAKTGGTEYSNLCVAVPVSLSRQSLPFDELPHRTGFRLWFVERQGLENSENLAVFLTGTGSLTMADANPAKIVELI